MAAGAASFESALEEWEEAGAASFESALEELKDAVRKAKQRGFFNYLGSAADMREEHNRRVLLGKDNPAGVAEDRLRRAKKTLAELESSKATVDGPLASIELIEIEAKIAVVKADITELKRAADPLYDIRRKEKLNKFLAELRRHLGPIPCPLKVGLFADVSIEKFIRRFGRRDATIVSYAETFLLGIIDADVDLAQDEQNFTFEPLPGACFFAFKDFVSSN